MLRRAPALLAVIRSPLSAQGRPDRCLGGRRRRTRAGPATRVPQATLAEARRVSDVNVYGSGRIEPKMKHANVFLAAAGHQWHTITKNGQVTAPKIRSAHNLGVGVGRER